ncbi:MAG: DMT family transporter [Candidatus Bruticola sp.]
MDNPALWIGLILAATAVQPILVKLGYRTNLDAAQLLLVKNFFSALIVLPFISSFRWLKREEIWRIARVSVLVLGINGFSLLALQLLPASVVITLTASVPIFVALINRFFFRREVLTFKFWIGVAICLAGVLLVAKLPEALAQGTMALTDLGGILACLAAVSCAVLYRVNMETLTGNFDLKLLWIWAFWINALVVFTVLSPFSSMPSISSWPIAVGVGLSAAVANSAFIWSIRLIGATSTSVFQLLQRPIIVLIAALLLGETLSLSQTVGVVLVFAGLPMARPHRLNSHPN